MKQIEDLKSENSALKDELVQSYSEVIHLMPEEYTSILLSCRDVELNSPQDLFNWKNSIIKTIASKVEPVENSSSLFSQRAFCPLCKKGSSSNFQDGFALPIGLQRHLEGYGNVKQCFVIKSAYKLAVWLYGLKKS